MQKQSFADVLQNRGSLKFCNIQRKTAVLESRFNKRTGLQLYQNFYRIPPVAASVDVCS